MFIGIDHGTTYIRFATACGSVFKLSRHEAAAMNQSELLPVILKGLDVHREQIKMMAVTYSMGDGIDAVTPIDRVINRSIKSAHGAGLHVGGGTQVFDTIRDSGLPAVVIPGLHRGNTQDQRFNIFSHGTSPEKIGIMYNVHRMGYDDMVVSDISSNTVTLSAANGRLLGALDACIFAPGIHHGPLDLEAIRDVDAGIYSANEAFTRAGVIKMTDRRDIKGLIEAFDAGDARAKVALDTLALFASMEMISMGLLLKENGIIDARNFISGSASEIPYVRETIKAHLGTEVGILGVWSAARGCAYIAEDVYRGKNEILGIRIDV